MITKITLTLDQKIEIMRVAFQVAWKGDGDVYPPQDPIDIYHRMIKAITED